MLEKLVHLRSILPSNQHYVRITIPNGTSYEAFQSAAHPGWDGRDKAVCKAFASDWHSQGRRAILLVPSLPAQIERNVIINPAHPDAGGIMHGLSEPVWWNQRLCG